MNLFIAIFIFFIVLFAYLHIMAQYKTSDYLEIYEIDYTTNAQLQEVCEVKQPFLFKFDNDAHDFFNLVQCEKLDGQFDEFDVNIKKVADYNNVEHETVEPLVLPYRSTRLMLKSDTNSAYISENNGEFIEDTNADAIYGTLNTLLRPSSTYSTKYDLLFGSRLAHTPLKYHNNSRMFLSVPAGKIRVKMTPWKSRKYIEYVKDYDSFEFVSPLNVWNTEKNKHTAIDKIKFIEFDIVAGYTLYIPPYWWYSIQFSGDENTTVCQTTYNTIISGIAHTKDLFMYILQQSNITRRKYKTIINGEMAKPDTTPTPTPTSTDATINENEETMPITKENVEVVDGSNYTKSMPEEINYIPKQHTEIISNAGIYHVAK